ncbi:uncharacterized protein RBU33_010213 [Hipposideros larvatus]
MFPWHVDVPVGYTGRLCLLLRGGGRERKVCSTELFLRCGRKTPVFYHSQGRPVFQDHQPHGHTQRAACGSRAAVCRPLWPRPRGQPVQTPAVTQKTLIKGYSHMATTTLLQPFDHEDRMSRVYLTHFLSVLDWFCPFTEEMGPVTGSEDRLKSSQVHVRISDWPLPLHLLRCSVLLRKLRPHQGDALSSGGYHTWQFSVSKPTCTSSALILHSGEQEAH